MKNNTFTLTLKSNVHGFKRGDVLTCRKTSEDLSGKIVILESDICGRWPMLYDEAGPELANGARLIGQAISLSRSLG